MRGSGCVRRGAARSRTGGPGAGPHAVPASELPTAQEWRSTTSVHTDRPGRRPRHRRRQYGAEQAGAAGAGCAATLLGAELDDPSIQANAHQQGVMWEVVLLNFGRGLTKRWKMYSAQFIPRRGRSVIEKYFGV